MKHPMQPIIIAEDGAIRFKANKIIEYLFNEGLLDLNKIATMNFSDEDHMQIAQLLGYSVIGFGDLSFAEPEVVAAADNQAALLFEET